MCSQCQKKNWQKQGCTKLQAEPGAKLKVGGWGGGIRGLRRKGKGRTRSKSGGVTHLQH